MQAQNKKVVCYYTNWSQYRQDAGKFLPENVDPSLCTHIVFAFAKLENNQVVAQEWNDESTEFSKGMYERVVDLKKQNPDLKILLSCGGMLTKSFTVLLGLFYSQINNVFKKAGTTVAICSVD
jgi:chitinase